MVRVELERVSGSYGFEAKDSNAHIVKFDSTTANGGEDAGVRPMQTLLMALGSCSAIDVVSILTKQRQQIDGFSIIIEGEREQGKEPSLWKEVHVLFQLKGVIDELKATRACSLSIERYCSVAETLRRAGANITWKVSITKE